MDPKKLEEVFAMDPKKLEEVFAIMGGGWPEGDLSGLSPEMRTLFEEYGGDFESAAIAYLVVQTWGESSADPESKGDEGGAMGDSSTDPEFEESFGDEGGATGGRKRNRDEAEGEGSKAPKEGRADGGKDLESEPLTGGDASQIFGSPSEAEALLRERVKELERQLEASNRPDQIDLTDEVETAVEPQGGGGALTGEGGSVASGMAVLATQQSKLVKVKEEKEELEEEMHEEGKYSALFIDKQQKKIDALKQLLADHNVDQVLVNRALEGV